MGISRMCAKGLAAACGTPRGADHRFGLEGVSQGRCNRESAAASGNLSGLQVEHRRAVGRVRTHGPTANF